MMTTVDGILKLLSRWPARPSATDAPVRIEALERRVSELESRFQRAPDRECPKCGAFALRFISETIDPMFNLAHLRRVTYECTECKVRMDEPHVARAMAPRSSIATP